MAASDAEITLAEDIASFQFDPLGFVRYVFPWGEGALEGEEGPDVWQTDMLRAIGDNMKTAEGAVRMAVSSGHNVGKTALCAWMILWFMSTRENPQIVVTANTKPQLSGKTWRELAKWHGLAIHGSWFEWTATRFALKQHPDTWFAMAVAWTKERSEAFAGTQEKHVLVIFDEASAIADVIWEVTEGAMYSPGALWLVFGNPTRNTGRFRECWRGQRARWETYRVDSRDAKRGDAAEINKLIESYGADSDFVRVRVEGKFPRAGSSQLIGEDIVEEAKARHGIADSGPILLGVDVARFGDDQTVILVRQGNVIIHGEAYRGMDTMQTAGRVNEAIDKWSPSLVMIDGVGVGGGVVDRLRQLNRNVRDVNAGAKAQEEKSFYNLRAEMWSRMRDWLREGGAIPPDNKELADDLIGPEYGFDAKNRLQLERKDDMKSRGLQSPDWGDALALTFAGAPLMAGTLKHRVGGRRIGGVDMDF